MGETGDGRPATELGRLKPGRLVVLSPTTVVPDSIVAAVQAVLIGGLATC